MRQARVELHRYGATHWNRIKIVLFKAHERIIMNKPNFLDDLQAKIQQAIDHSPVKDVEKNVKAMLSQGFSRLDLVTREEFDIHVQVLAKTRAKLEELEVRVAELEEQLKNK